VTPCHTVLTRRAIEGSAVVDFVDVRSHELFELAFSFGGDRFGFDGDGFGSAMRLADDC